MAYTPGNAGTAMTATTTTRARTTRAAAANTSNATPAAAPAVKNRRVSLGTLFPTSNDMFMSGPISGPTSQYLNQAEFLGLLGPAPEGFAWRVKAFFKETKAGDVADVVAELEPLQR
jgi:hypothetical protein